jgi:hypothetical protein
MNRQHVTRRAALAAPALISTLFSAVLTVAVVALWLGQVMPVFLAVVIGLGFDGAWLSSLAYGRRLAAQGDHDRRVTVLGWVFGLLATGVMVAHALTTSAPAAWLAVSWLPVAAKALWWLHGLWEATEISPRAKAEISRTLQTARDQAALARAGLTARARVEQVRMESLANTGVTVARVQGRSADRLAGAWAALAQVREEEDQAAALTRVLAPATPQWELPLWDPAESPSALSAGERAEIRPETTVLRFEAPEVSAPRVPEQAPAPAAAVLSAARAVRTLMAEGVTDPKEVLARVPELTGRPVNNPRSLAREIRNARSAAKASTVPFGFGGGK